MILGVSGLAGSGKDQLASFLVQDHGFIRVSLADVLKRFLREVFDFSEEQLWGPSAERNKSDPRYLHRRAGSLGSTFVGDMVLKGTVFEKHAHLVEDGHLPSPPEDEYLTPRHALQQIGTQFGRYCYQDVWINYALKTAGILLEDSRSVYDSRQGVLMRVLPKRNEGVVIPDVRFWNELSAIHAAGGKVVRIVRGQAGLKGEAAKHTSETEQQTIEDDEFDLVIDNNGTLEQLREQGQKLLSLC